MSNRNKHMADESEMFVNLRAMRLSWIFVTLALLVWSVYEFISTGELGVQVIIMCLGSAVFFIAKLIMTKRLTSADAAEDEDIEE